MRFAGPIVSLVLLFALALGLRARWGTLSRTTQGCWIAGAVLGILVRSLIGALRWEFSISRINDALLWARIGGYILLVVLFTCLRPRRFTVPAAVILLLPLFSASVFLPLELVFDPTPRRVSNVGDHVVMETIAWQRDDNDNRAVDYTISRRVRWLPLFQKSFRSGRLYRTQCDIDALRATLPSPHRVLVYCPPGAPGEPPLLDDVPLGNDPKPVAAAVIGSKS